MENYIVINGKKAELTDEQLEKLGIGIKVEKDKYEEMFHRDLHDSYYFINVEGNIGHFMDEYDPEDEMYYGIGNYCKDETIMKQRALHETLNRLLWRASMIAGEMDNPWDGKHTHYSICHRIEGIFDVDHICHYKYNEVYFPTEESAKEAIENIVKLFMKEHPDFVW